MSALESHLCLKSTLPMQLDSTGRTWAHPSQCDANCRANGSACCKQLTAKKIIIIIITSIIKEQAASSEYGKQNEL